MSRTIRAKKQGCDKNCPWCFPKDRESNNVRRGYRNIIEMEFGELGDDQLGVVENEEDDR